MYQSSWRTSVQQLWTPLAARWRWTCFLPSNCGDHLLAALHTFPQLLFLVLLWSNHHHSFHLTHFSLLLLVRLSKVLGKDPVAVLVLHLFHLLAAAVLFLLLVSQPPLLLPAREHWCHCHLTIVIRKVKRRSVHAVQEVHLRRNRVEVARGLKLVSPEKPLTGVRLPGLPSLPGDLQIATCLRNEAQQRLARLLGHCLTLLRAALSHQLQKRLIFPDDGQVERAARLSSGLTSAAATAVDSQRSRFARPPPAPSWLRWPRCWAKHLLISHQSQLNLVNVVPLINQFDRCEKCSSLNCQTAWQTVKSVNENSPSQVADWANGMERARKKLCTWRLICSFSASSAPLTPSSCRGGIKCEFWDGELSKVAPPAVEEGAAGQEWIWKVQLGKCHQATQLESRLTRTEVFPLQFPSSHLLSSKLPPHLSSSPPPSSSSPPPCLGTSIGGWEGQEVDKLPGSQMKLRTSSKRFVIRWQIRADAIIKMRIYLGDENNDTNDNDDLGCCDAPGSEDDRLQFFPEQSLASPDRRQNYLAMVRKMMMTIPMTEWWWCQYLSWSIKTLSTIVCNAARVNSLLNSILQ